MSIDYDSFYTRKPKKETTEESKLIEDNARLTLEVKKLGAQCRILEKRLEKYEDLALHCGKCSKPITLEYLKKRSDENRIACSECIMKASQT